MKSQIYGHKDIHANTLGQKNYENENIKNDDQRNQLKVNLIKINIDKNIIKDYNNSPLSSRCNKNFNDNKKRDANQKSPRPNYNTLGG